MNSPLSRSSSGLLELNSTAPLLDDPDADEHLETALAATVLQRLQAHGWVNAKTRLADRLPAAPGFDSDTVEERLKELIRDSNANGRLDLPVDGLLRSGLVKNGATAHELELALRGADAGGVSKAFLFAQATSTGVTRYGSHITEKGELIQAYSQGMSLADAQDRDTAAFVDTLKRGIAHDPGAAEALAEEAIAYAQLLVARGRQPYARELLFHAADALAAARGFAVATQVYAELRREPHGSTQVQTIKAMVERVRAEDSTFNESSDALRTTSPAGAQVNIQTRDYLSTVGEVAQTRMEQLAFQGRMEAVLGHVADPQNLEQVRAYFQAFSTGKSLDTVGAELQHYLKSYYKHAGQGVEWPPAIAPDSRPAELSRMLQGHPADDAGRKMIDCEGYAYLAAHLLGEVHDAKGRRRFTTLFATRPGHIIASLFDVQNKRAITVNNDTVSRARQARTEPALNTLIASQLCGTSPDIFGIGLTQSRSKPYSSGEFRAPPKEGALVWNGSRIVGHVIAKTQQDYLSFAAKHQSASYEAYVNDVMGRGRP